MRIEIKALSKYPVIVSIDLNGDIPNFSDMEEAISEGELWDMGSIQHWDLDGEGVNLPTCRGHGSRTDHRRDYIFCNAQILPEVQGFRRGPFGEIDVHTILYVAVQQRTASADVWRHCKPKALVPDHQDDESQQAWEKAAQEAISRRMEQLEGTLDGNHRRHDTESLWKNW